MGTMTWFSETRFYFTNKSNRVPYARSREQTFRQHAISQGPRADDL